MADTSFVQLVLTCGSWQEAQRIADSLLDKRLVACVEMFDIKSKYHWQDEIVGGKEIKLIMETIADHFDKIEKEVAKLHGYDTFVLQQLPVTKLSKPARIWWQEAVTNNVDKLESSNE